jgi:hypothetical protein
LKDINFVVSVSERDIDLLMLEELTVNDDFCRWFSNNIFEHHIYDSTYGAWHSVVAEENRESDLVFIFLSDSGERIAVLIENKIDAPPQPEQAIGYELRGERGQQEGYWDFFKTCLIAPARYLSSSKQTEMYQHEISYEAIMDFFNAKASYDKRFAYKARVVNEAIEQNRRGYQPVLSEAMTNFVKDYVHYASQHYPSLGVQEAKARPAGSTWIMFKPFGSKAKIELCHQMTTGLVKILLYGSAGQIEEIKEKYGDKLESHQSITNQFKSQSVSIQCSVPPLDPINKTFLSQQMEVDIALIELMALLAVLNN